MDQTRRLTVLHLVPEDSYRGAQVYAGRLRDAFANDGAQRHLVAALFEAPPAALSPDMILGGKTGLLRRAGLDPRVAHSLRTTVRRMDVDVIVAHGGEALKYAVAARTAAAVVYYKIGLSSAELQRRTRLWLYRRLVGRLALAVGVSWAIRDQLHEVLGIPQSRLVVIPNGRDPELYRPGGQQEQAVPPLVLFVGQLERGKRPGLFLEVIERLRDQHVDITAAMVGDGPMRSHLEGPAGALGVALLGVRSDVPELLRAASVLVMTSAWNTEGMPGVLVEAGLTGLPVVSTAAAGVRDIVLDGETGFVVESDTATGIADKVAVLVRSPDLATAMGVAARAHCESEFTIQASSRRWRELMDDLPHGLRIGWVET